MMDSPDFLARLWFVDDRFHRRGTDQLLLLADTDHCRCGVSLLKITVVRVVVDVTVGLPDGMAGVFVEGDHILHVDAVELNDQQIAVQNGRGGGAAEMIADKIAALPQFFTSLSVEAGGAVGAKGDEYAPPSTTGVQDA